MRTSRTRAVWMIVLLTWLLSGCASHSVSDNAPAPAAVSNSQALSGGELDLLSASGEGDLARVKDLLDQGVSVNTKDEGGRTPLIEASDNGHADIVKLLLYK